MTASSGGVHPQQLCCRGGTAVALSAIDAAPPSTDRAEQPTGGASRVQTEHDSPKRPWRGDAVAGTMLRVPQTSPETEPVGWTTFTHRDLRV